MTNNELRLKLDFYGLGDSNTLSQNIIGANKLFNNYYINNFSKRIRELGFDFDKFNFALTKFDGTITGSFILQCILNEKWDSDIDIYFNEDICKNIENKNYDANKKFKYGINYLITLFKNCESKINETNKLFFSTKLIYESFSLRILKQ